ncbi:MAG: hypothetical protein JSV09_06605, partial [Thermoplasmata archaeon]
NMVFKRFDDNERDASVLLDFRDDWAEKILTIDESISNIDTATLWVYGKARDDIERTGDSHYLLVNHVRHIYFNPNVEFSDPVENENWWVWISFDIPTSWLNQGSNIFKICDGFSQWTERNLYIGIDTDNNYEASNILQNKVQLDGELMIYLKLTFV